ncbi:hypothetical protein ACYCSE_01780 [Paenibacillus sp. SEL1]|uniref:hypothetical protein n=1 Tax=Paenibacillus TaxID=44249 RepID=UPI002023D8D1|nr:MULTISPECIES: hypothetical protein [Paenibacillus]MCP3809013.1 hypothetical protein [Paenibacillus sp. Lou8.1]URJ50899.3 hypothetical protein MF626_000279 [Paenibacillus polymyxa]
MDYRLSIGSNLSREALGKFLYNMICEVLVMEINFYEVEVKDWSDTRQVSISCTYFSISINLDDEDDYLERFREMNLEDHGVDTNVLISIQFVSRTFDIGWLKILEVIGKLLRLNDQDLVVEDDSSYPLLKRIKGRLFINNNLDEYQTRYITKENLELLNYPYLEKDFFKDSGYRR